jgi:hypothetical protein
MTTLKKVAGAGIFVAAAANQATTTRAFDWGPCSDYYNSCSEGGGQPYNWDSECDEYNPYLMWTEVSCGDNENPPNYEAYGARTWCYGESDFCC